MTYHPHKLRILGREMQGETGFIVPQVLDVKNFTDSSVNDCIIELDIRRHVITHADLKILLETFDNVRTLTLVDVQFDPYDDHNVQIQRHGFIQKLVLSQTVVPDCLITALPNVSTLMLHSELCDMEDMKLHDHWVYDRATFEAMVLHFRGLINVVLDRTSLDTITPPSSNVHNSSVRVAHAPAGVDLSNYFIRARHRPQVIGLPADLCE
ncbi:hypothetical protein BG004_006496 [Podila humilis]|nr:hypothetical protein BG004_006496 [Podila humilis]